MSNVVAASTGRIANPSVVGPNPVFAVIGGGLTVCAGLIALIWIAGLAGGGPVVLIPLILVAFVMFWTAATGLVALLNLRHWFAARKSVDNGDIAPDWVVRNAACTGIAMVDETARLIYISGAIVPFSDVRRLTTTESGGQAGPVPKLHFTFINNGQTMRLTVGTDTNAALQHQFDRLCAALELS